MMNTLSDALTILSFILLVFVRLVSWLCPSPSIGVYFFVGE